MRPSSPLTNPAESSVLCTRADSTASAIATLSGTASLYRISHRPIRRSARSIAGIRAIVHTHSNHATAFAACHRPIPLCLTAIADEFGGSIPCAPFASNDGDAIGRGILEHRTAGPAILLANHGVFAWGPTADAALKAAVMVEDVAKTVLLARQLGDIHELDADEATKWFDRYRHRYGQNRAA